MGENPLLWFIPVRTNKHVDGIQWRLADVSADAVELERMLPSNNTDVGDLV